MLIAPCLFLLNQNDVRPNLHLLFALAQTICVNCPWYNQSIPITRAIYCVLLIIIMFDRFFLPRECHFVLTDKTSHNPKIVQSILGLCHRVRKYHIQQTPKKYSDIIFLQKNSVDFNLGETKCPETKQLENIQANEILTVQCKIY